MPHHFKQGGTIMAVMGFDDQNIRWNTLENIAHLKYCVLDIDTDGQIYDVLFKFAAHQQIVLHRHLVQNNMLVIQGEHRLYYADGRVMEIRPVGRYTVSMPSDEPHREGGGDQDVVILFSIRGKDGVLYEILDESLAVVGTISSQDLVELYKAQQIG